jgi:hypothetical protein
MKKFLLTFVALLALTTSVNAQKKDFKVKRTEFSWMNYDWGKGSRLKGLIGNEAELVGDVTATVLGTKRLEFKNNTGQYIKVEITFNFVQPNGSTSRSMKYPSPRLSPWGTWTSEGIPNCKSLKIESMRVIK